MNAKKLNAALPLSDSRGVSSVGKEDNTNVLSPDKFNPSASDDKKNPNGYDTGSVPGREEEPPYGDDFDN